MAADIETLIRQALARQNGFDPMVRAKIYQSSRNALAKMIANSGAIPLDVINARNRALEETIAKIEQEFTAELNNPSPQVDPEPAPPPPPPPQVDVAPQVSVPESFDPAPPPQQPVEPQFTPPPQAEAYEAPPLEQQIQNPVMPDPVVPDMGISNPEIPIPSGQVRQPADHVFTPDPVDSGYQQPIPEQRDMGTGHEDGYVRPSRKPFRYLVWVIALIILVLAGWIAYEVTTTFLEGQQQSSNRSITNSARTNNNDESFITILQPEDPSALLTSGNGTAKILNDVSQPAIRIQSVRKPDSPETPAAPLLLELAPGVLKEIAGRRATVEIQAKSGDNGPATFTVSCEFGGEAGCGRKRFRIGLQPEAVVFSIELDENFGTDQKAYLAINTDVTSAAALSGRGANVDIIYARLKAGE